MGQAPSIDHVNLRENTLGHVRCSISIRNYTPHALPPRTCTTPKTSPLPVFVAYPVTRCSSAALTTSRPRWALRCVLLAAWVGDRLGDHADDRGGAEPGGHVVEYQKKAEFISSFTRFVDWPDAQIRPAQIRLLSSASTAPTISRACSQEAIQNHQIKGRPDGDQASAQQGGTALLSCALHQPLRARPARDRSSAKSGAKTSSPWASATTFLGKGGVVNFVNVGGQVRFQISIDAASSRKADLQFETAPIGDAFRRRLRHAASRGGT